VELFKDMDPLQFNPPQKEQDICKSTSFRVTTYQAVKNSASDKHTGLDSILQFSPGRYKSAAFIMKTLREAFYINDSINHLLDHFEYYETPKGKEKKLPSNWDTPKQATDRAQKERTAAIQAGDNPDEPRYFCKYPSNSKRTRRRSDWYESYTERIF
jgi:hypothetical protein